MTEGSIAEQTGNCLFSIVWDLHWDNNELPLPIQQAPSQGNVTVTVQGTTKREDFQTQQPCLSEVMRNEGSYAE